MMRRMIMRMTMINFHLLFISCILHNFYQGLEPNLNINHLISNHLSNHRVFSVTTIEDISRTNHTAEDTLLTNHTAVTDGTLMANHTAEEASADGSIQCTSQSLAAISILHFLHLAIERAPIDTAVAPKALESSAFDPEWRFQHATSLPATLSTAANHQNDSQTAADHAVVNAKSLFGSFAWKGFGLCLRKSIINWNACGVSIRLPVTGNFPEYDNIVYYPRMTCFLGVAYPYSVYLTVSLSLPSQTAMLPLLLLSNGTTRGSSIRSLISRRTTDSVRRYGLSWSLKYDQQRGSHFSVGPTCSYVPGLKFVAMITHCLSYLSTQLQLLLRKWTTQLSVYIRRVFDNNPTASNAAAAREAYVLHRSIIHYSQQVIRRFFRWLERKSPLLAYNLGIFASKHSFFGVSSNIILELQPFFPLHKELVRLLKKSYEHYHSSTYAAAMSPQRNRLNQTENETAVGMMPAPMMSCA